MGRVGVSATRQKLPSPGIAHVRAPRRCIVVRAEKEFKPEEFGLVKNRSPRGMHAQIRA